MKLDETLHFYFESTVNFLTQLRFPIFLVSAVLLKLV
jgi:hypothetical protein